MHLIFLRTFCDRSFYHLHFAGKDMEKQGAQPGAPCLVSREVVKMGLVSFWQSTLTIIPQALPVTLFGFRYFLRQKKKLCVQTKANTVLSFVYIAVNSKTLPEVVYCIMLVALVVGQPNDPLSLHKPHWQGSHSSDSLSSFPFSEEVVVRGNHFELDSMNLPVLCCEDMMWKHSLAPSISWEKTSVTLLETYLY